MPRVAQVNRVNLPWAVRPVVLVRLVNRKWALPVDRGKLASRSAEPTVHLAHPVNRSKVLKVVQGLRANR
jgi:hypothetical protein